MNSPAASDDSLGLRALQPGRVISQPVAALLSRRIAAPSRGVLLLHPVLLPIPRVKPEGLESVVLFVLQVGGCPPAAIDAQCRRRPFQLRLELHPMTCLAGDVPAGSSYVDRRLRASLYESDWADEQMGGVTYLFFLRKLAEDVETKWDIVLAALERIRSTLVNRAAMFCNVTAEASHWMQLKPQLA